MLTWCRSEPLFSPSVLNVMPGGGSVCVVLTRFISRRGEQGEEENTNTSDQTSDQMMRGSKNQIRDEMRGRDQGSSASAMVCECLGSKWDESKGGEEIKSRATK